MLRSPPTDMWSVVFDGEGAIVGQGATGVERAPAVNGQGTAGSQRDRIEIQRTYIAHLEGGIIERCRRQ